MGQHMEPYREPCSSMSAEKWRDYCKQAANQPGYVPKTDRPREVKDFKCDRCGMTWSTGMALDGLPHKALVNKCGGVWRGASGEGQPAPVVEVSIQAPPHEYEVDDDV